MSNDFAFLRDAHTKELKRRGMKATRREELVPEKAMMSSTNKGKNLHSYYEDGKVHHTEVPDDG